MTATVDTGAVTVSGPRAWEDRLAPAMFFLTVIFLIVLAGLIHRYPNLDPTSTEAYLIVGAIGALWLVFAAEAALRFLLRDRARSAWRALFASAAVARAPPLRLRWRSRILPNHVWLPRLGWAEANARLCRTMERVFSVPMVLVALLVVPLFVLEYLWGEQIRAEPALALCLDISSSVIWLAFAVELTLMLAIAERPWLYCLVHWIDVVIVLLPLIEVMPLFRLLRLGQVLRLEQLSRWGRLYRLKALSARGWRAFLVLGIISRLMNRSPERRLKRLRELLQAKEEEMDELRREMADLETLIAKKAVNEEAASKA